MKTTFAFLAASLTATLGGLAACHSEPPPHTPDATPSALPSAPSAAPSATATAPVSLPSDQAPPGLPIGPQPSKSAAFAAALYAKVDASAKGQNFLYAPENLREALAMAWLGAKGQTADELARALALGGDGKAFATAEKAERAENAAAAGKATLKVANKVWVDKKSKVEEAWFENVHVAFGNGPQDLGQEFTDFRTGAEASRGTINKWVSTATNDKIKELLPKGSLTQETRVVLTNAVYFKGTWATTFDKKATVDEPFAAPSGAVKVPTMHKTGEYRLAKFDDGALAVDVPYAGSQLVATFILPPTGKSLEEWTATGLGDRLATLDATGQSMQVALALPKFTFGWGGSVKPQLQGLGISNAFTDSADFSGISPEKPGLKISDVFHKTFVAVDEEGTEAAAATGVVMATRGLVLPVAFKADRPFLFLVRNPKNGALFFFGRIANPAQK